MKINLNTKKAFTLIEMLIVISSFAVLAVLVTMTVAYSLRGSKKSESSGMVRSELEYAVGVMERQLRNANNITGCASSSINYEDENGVNASFSCSGGYLASGSARLTSDKVELTTCQFTCSDVPGKSYVPKSVKINLTGASAQDVGVEGATVALETEILLRNY
jgi:type II secretory pathway pseudopilin PulG